MKDKITAESFEKIISEEIKNSNGYNAHVRCFSLHQQAIQQMLEEAGSELKTQKEWSAWYDSYFEEHDEIPDSIRTFEWMRSESSQVILKLKEENSKLKMTIKRLQSRRLVDED